MASIMNERIMNMASITANHLLLACPNFCISYILELVVNKYVYWIQLEVLVNSKIVLVCLWLIEHNQ